MYARVQAQFTGPGLAEALGWAQSTVSKIETGRQLATADDIRSCTQACAVDEAATLDLLALQAETKQAYRRWKEQMRSGQVMIQRRYGDLAKRAQVIRNFELVFIPGLLQTAEYARSRIAENAWLQRTPDDPSISQHATVDEAAIEIDAATHRGPSPRGSRAVGCPLGNGPGTIIRTAVTRLDRPRDP